MWAVWPASCQAARTPVELIESAGWFSFRVAVVDATPFTRGDWKERHCSSTYPQPLKIRVGSDPSRSVDVPTPPTRTAFNGS